MSTVFIEQERTQIELNEVRDGIDLIYCSACGNPFGFAETHAPREGFIFCATCVKESKERVSGRF